jgi:electron transport complex protein RnfG
MSAGNHRLIQSAASLATVAIIGTTLLAGVNELTAERIAEQERRVVLEQLGQIISPDRYDNRLQEDLIVVEDESYFPRGQSVTVYRARQDGEPTALVMKLAAVNGYNGMIRLLVGINADGSLSGVRVASHKETPGLGDAIEIERSDWVLGFNQRSLQDPSIPGWAVKRDGGKFDQFTGATITPRAVVEAVRMALEYYQKNQALLFEVQAQGSPVEET